MNELPAKMSSPCRSICQVEGAAKICVGCGRSLKEIATWGRMSETERLSIMAELSTRMAAFPK
jgi:hypothetical protein